MLSMTTFLSIFLRFGLWKSRSTTTDRNILIFDDQGRWRAGMALSHGPMGSHQIHGINIYCQ